MALRVEFLSPLLLEYVDATSDRLHEDFVSRHGKRIITVPRGFITDYDSVPRWPVVYWLMGGRRHKGAVIHDFLYSIDCPAALRARGRAWADRVFRAALRAQGVGALKAATMYAGVRAGGARFYQRAPAPETAPADAGASGA